MALLRDHGADRAWPRYSPLNGAMGAPCVHAGGVAVVQQTTASWVSELSPGRVRHWVTGTAAPCVSLFKPVEVGRSVDLGPPGADRADGRSLWWRHEVLHRSVLRDPARLAPLLLGERDATEERWLREPPESEIAFREADALLERWLERVREQPQRDRRPLWARRAWRLRDRRAGLATARSSPASDRPVIPLGER
jgi:hypothetical protein